MKATISIPYPYNPGECRISRKVIGPRGGESWQTIHSQPATGGNVVFNDLPEGEYKKTWWSNGWPSSVKFSVIEMPEGEADIIHEHE